MVTKTQLDRITNKADTLVAAYIAGNMDVSDARKALVALNREAVKLYDDFLDEKAVWKMDDQEAQNWMDHVRDQVIFIVDEAGA